MTLSNQHEKLFDGPDHHLRPVCSAEARSSGLLKGIVAHSIFQDGVGFPYLSPTCWRRDGPTVCLYGGFASGRKFRVETVYCIELLFMYFLLDAKPAARKCNATWWELVTVNLLIVYLRLPLYLLNN